ncbi:MAG: phosphate ABC transporter substrate-binding protein [Methylococcales bacterium]|jgi:phosphate transport system substrate-binding protein|nr:phosphate ABC transporter substrate-binding protein [Methylococcales bacterium]MBT7410988.1 phosphate ABC transporter substrate-binding protein [Methylococcales bacterium]
MRLNRLLTLLISTLFITACGQSGTAKEHLVITGSSTLAPLISEIAKRYEQLHPNTRIDVQTGGSSRGISDVKDGASDIGMISRSLKTSEHDLFGFPIAQDGICIITHKSNPVEKIDRNTLLKIYTGKITQWTKSGDSNKVITVVNKADGRSTLELFLKYTQLKPSEIKAHIIIGDNEQGIKTISNNPDAIGYVSIGTAQYHSDHGTPIKMLGLNGIQPSLKNIKNHTYPLSRTLNLVTKKKPSGLVQKFINFTQSKQVHDLIKAQYFIQIGS